MSADPALPASTSVSRSQARLALVGNPNTGKTTLFNALTGFRQRVGNYPGVTVERRQGRVRLPESRPRLDILDLPGSYSLSAHSEDEAVVEVVIPDDASRARFSKAVLRVEAVESCRDLNIGAWLNGKRLLPYEHEGTELFAPVVHTSHGYPAARNLKFYAVPLRDVIPGTNKLEIRNLDKKRASCQILSLELGFYR